MVKSKKNKDVEKSSASQKDIQQICKLVKDIFTKSPGVVFVAKKTEGKDDKGLIHVIGGVQNLSNDEVVSYINKFLTKSKIDGKVVSDLLTSKEKLLSGLEKMEKFKDYVKEQDDKLEKINPIMNALMVLVIVLAVSSLVTNGLLSNLLHLATLISAAGLIYFYSKVSELTGKIAAAADLIKITIHD